MTNFREFIDSELSVGFDQFVTLRYFHRYHPFEDASFHELLAQQLRVAASIELQAARMRRFGEGMDRVDEWLAEIKKAYGEDGFRYLKIMEIDRFHQSFSYHILVRGCEWDKAAFKEHWKPLWHTLSGGTAFERKIDERTGGFIRHLVFNADCLLETNDGKKYRKYDFESDFEGDA